MNIRRKNSLKLILILSILIITIYFPYIINGGFGPADDLSFINSITLKSEYDLSLFSSLSTNSGRFRPVGDLLTNIIFLIFKDNSKGYIVVQLLIWFSSVGVISFILKYIFEKKVAYIFLLFGSFPCFSTSSFFSPYMISYTLSILFWSLSLLSLIKYLIYHKIYNYYLCYLLFLVSLLTLPLVLPLILITSFLPIIYNKYAIKTQIHDNFLFLKYLFPIVVLSLIYLLSKLYLTKLYQNDGIIYGMNGMDLKSIFQGLYFIITIIIEIPILLFSTLNTGFRWEIIIIIISTSLYFYLLKQLPTNHKIKFYNINSFNRKMFILFIFSLISCMSIFIISGYPAVTFGHYNKMMLPAFVLISIIISMIINKIISTKYILIPIFISFTWISSMSIQLSNFVESWNLREYIFKDCVYKLNSTDMGENPFLIACVPFFTNKNYNNEEVFWLSWDFESGLNFFGADPITAFPFSWRSLYDDDKLNIQNNFIIYRFSKFSFDDNLWYYEFDNIIKNSNLIKITNAVQFSIILDNVKEHKINYHRFIPRDKMRTNLKTFLLKIIDI